MRRISYLDKPPIPPGQPILAIPPFLWAKYTKTQWYSWGNGRDYMVTFYRGAWHWNIHSMADEGKLLTADHEANSEDEGYPTPEAAMKACERYYERGR